MAMRPKIRLDEAIESYLLQLQSEQASAATQRVSRATLRRLHATVGTPKNPNPLLHSLTPAVLMDYCYGPNGIRNGARGAGIRNATQGRPVAAVTFNQYRSLLNSFFRWALVIGYVDENPMAVVRPARPDTPKSRLRLNGTELLALMDYCTNPLERIACAVGMNTGLRSNDIRHLTIFDVDRAGGYIQTEIRKTRKLDDKPITVDLERELAAWYRVYAASTGRSGPEDLPSDWLLLPTRRGLAPVEAAHDPYQVKGLRPHAPYTHPWQLVQRPLGRMGYPTKGEGFHTLRRSSARVLFDRLIQEESRAKDQALMIVQAYLNHSSTIQTQTYLGLDHERAMRDTLLRGKSFLGDAARREQDRIAPSGGAEQIRAV